ncbi:MAG: DUF748 domain-containing protein [Candidatus Rokubacteria bacterium]|nr:DUF748 domain-containing protein [Candidatus Rokubacteria bacterium]
MRRAGRRVALAALLGFVVVAGVALAALPEIVRRVAVDQLTTLTRRAVAIDDVDLNLFTGRVTINGFRLARRDAPDAALAFDRLGVRVAYTPLLTRHARIMEIRLVAPRVHVTRTGPETFDFSDLLALIPPADPTQPAPRWTVALDEMIVERGVIVALDRVTDPASEWRVEDVAVDVAALSTRKGAAPGRATFTARLNGAAIGVAARAVALDAGTAAVKATVENFALALVAPYVPATVHAVPRAGTARVAADVKVTRERGALGVAVAGDIGLSGLAVARRDEAEPFLTLDRLGVAIVRAEPLQQAVTLRAIEVDGLSLTANRLADGAIDLLGLVTAASDHMGGPEMAPHTPQTLAPGPAQPARGSISVERLTVRRASALVRDRAVSPAAEWRVRGLDIDAAALTTDAAARPGTFALKTALNDAQLALTDGTLRLAPVEVGGRLAVDRVDLAWARPYVAGLLPTAPPTGRLGARLVIALAPGATLRGSASGDVVVEQVNVTHGGGAPLASLATARVKIARADLATREVRLSAVEVDGLALSAARDERGVIDALAAFVPPPPASASSPAATATAVVAPAVAASPAAPTAPVALRVDRIVLRGGGFAFSDRGVTPHTVLPITDLDATVRDFAWPAATPAVLDVTATLPGGGKLATAGSVIVSPLEADITMSLRDAPVEPYAAYHPFRARIEGRFGGDSRSQVKMGPNGIVATSRGTSWGDRIAVRDPANPSAPPALSIERMELAGIDFGWPTHGRVATVTITRPDARVTRDAAGALDVVALFALRDVGPPSAAAAPPAAVPAAAPPASGAEPLPLAVDVGRIVLKDGLVRFTDRSTQPAFVESISRIAVAIDGLSSTPGRRAKLDVSAIVGGSSTLAVSGEVAPLGPLFADVVVDLEDYTLPSVNPYADRAIAWIVERGTLGATIRAHVENGALTANNELDVKRLKVVRAQGHDTAKQRLGLPLGVIVALITDRNDGFKTTIPIAGRIDDPQFQWSDAIWAAARNVVVNVAAAPFRAIGRLFTGSDNRVETAAVEPVTFAPGTATLTPETEGQLVRVAGFLRGAPLVRLELAPIVTRRDAARLRAGVVRTRLETIQRERALPDWAAAVAAEYRRRFPGTTPAPALEEQIVKLTDAEPLPDDALRELRRRRLQAVLDALTGAEGIPRDRLKIREVPSVSADSGPGRVDFELAE